jgi:hypothetical protein
MPKTSEKTPRLSLEVEAVEAHCKPGCGSSTTNRLCTCPVASASTTGSLFTAKSTH